MELERSRWAWHTWVLIAGCCSAAAGAALLGMSQVERTGTFGWFAAVPVGAVVVPAPGEPTAAGLFGYALAGVGLVVLGWRVANGLSTLDNRRLPLALSSRGLTALTVMACLAVLLVLAGASVLLGAPSPMPLGSSAGSPEMSVAYSSELVITLDAVQRPLLLPGALLLLGGSLAGAAALGWRAGRPAPDPRTDAGTDEDVLR